MLFVGGDELSLCVVEVLSNINIRDLGITQDYVYIWVYTDCCYMVVLAECCIEPENTNIDLENICFINISSNS